MRTMTGKRAMKPAQLEAMMDRVVALMEYTEDYLNKVKSLRGEIREMMTDEMTDRRGREWMSEGWSMVDDGMATAMEGLKLAWENLWLEERNLEKGGAA